MAHKSVGKKGLRQQGDVLCFGGERIPEGAKPMKIQNGLYILAEGETTGHKHATAAVLEDVQGFEKEGVFYLDVKKAEGVTVIHEEHKPIILKKGTYRIGIVREKDHFADEIRKVAD
jgi:hypothetical protein